MKYKHIIFDFGNVLGRFDEDYILGKFCKNEAAFPILKKAIFENWKALDAGSIDYEENVAHAVTLVPEHLKETVVRFFQDWNKYLTPLAQTWELVRELKDKGYSLYILSNASVNFAEHASQYDITKEFDGIVFSAVIQKLKPEPDIYRYLFDTYSLKPSECFFIDDCVENIIAARSLGMDGIIFTGDTEAVKAAIRI